MMEVRTTIVSATRLHMMGVRQHQQVVTSWLGRHCTTKAHAKHSWPASPCALIRATELTVGGVPRLLLSSLSWTATVILTGPTQRETSMASPKISTRVRVFLLRILQ